MKSFILENPKFTVVDYEEYDEELDDYEEPEENRIIPFFEVNESNLNEAIKELKILNKVDIPASKMDKVLSVSNKLSSILLDILLFHEIPFHIAFDSAAAYAETAMRGAFNIDIEVGKESIQHIKNLATINIVNEYVNGFSMSNELKHIVMESFIKSYLGTIEKNTQKSISTDVDLLALSKQKFSQRLNELYGNIKNDRNPSGVTSVRKTRERSQK